MPAAPTMLTTTADTLDILQTQRKYDVSDVIWQLDPSKAPLIRLTGPSDERGALIEKEVATDPEFRHFEDQNVPALTAINFAAGYNAAAVSIVVDAAAYVKIGDIIIIPRTLERWYVSNVVTATNTLTVTRGWGGSTPLAVLDNDEVMVLGDASTEGSSAPAERGTVKTLFFNYIQDFRYAYSMTRTLQNTTLYTGKEWAAQTKKAWIEFALKLERSMMFGIRNQDTTGALPRRTSGGLLQFISANVLDASNLALNEPTLENFCRQLFRYNATGNGQQKFCVCSPRIISAISSWAKNRLYMSPEAKKYGMVIRTYESATGTLHFIPHWLLQDSSVFRSWGFVLDVPAIKIRYEQGSDIQVEERIQTPGDHIRRDGIFGYLGWEVAWDDYHGRIINVGGY